MLHAAISEVTTLRWELSDELDALARHGFDAISIWRTKLSDIDAARGRWLIERAGVRVSSLQWIGGFTGSDGRSFAEAIEDGIEAIEEAAALSAGVLLVHPGCRGGHTLSHARRLLEDALGQLASAAAEQGVTLAVMPTHRRAAGGCGYLTSLEAGRDLVRRCNHPGIRLAIDLWHFGHEPDLPERLAELLPDTAVVRVADRLGLPSNDQQRLPPGEGLLPLGRLVSAIEAAGYRGDVEFECVGETVQQAGYESTLARLRATADRWGFAGSPGLIRQPRHNAGRLTISD
jgi:sugar phosphate isomerase/epimerase